MGDRGRRRRGRGLAEDGHDHGLLLGRLTAEFAGLVGRQELTPGFAVLAMAVALALGAGHALAPGHGKLLMATYLVNERGSLRQAVSVAGTVALTHTAGVLVLGVVLAAGLHFVPHRVYTLLTVLSGALVVTVGLSLLRRAWRDRDRAGGHGHGAPHADAQARRDGGHGGTTAARARRAAAGRPGGRRDGTRGRADAEPVGGGGAAGRGGAGAGLVRRAAGGGVRGGHGGVVAGDRPAADPDARPAGAGAAAWMSHRAWRLLPLVTSSAVIVVGVGVATTALLA